MTKMIYLLLSLLLVNSFYLYAQDEEETVSEEGVAEEQPALAPINYTYAPFVTKETEKYNFATLFNPQEQVSAEVLYQNENDIIGQADDFDLTEVRVNVNNQWAIGDNLYLGLGFKYTMYYIAQDQDFLENSGDEDERSFHAFDIPITLKYAADRLQIALTVMPGLHTDFRYDDEPDKEEYLVSGEVEVGYMVNPRLYLFGGAFIYDRLGEYAVIPTGGFYWRPEPDFDVIVRAPFMARARYHYSQKLKITASYEYDMNQFFVRIRDNGVVDEDDLRFLFFRVGVGFEYFLTDRLSVKLTVGGTLDSEIQLRQRSDFDFEGGSGFAMVGFNIYGDNYQY